MHASACCMINQRLHDNIIYIPTLTEECDSEDEEWSNCSNMCHTINCKGFRLSSFCDDNDVECIPGCKCKDGMVHDNNGVCINEEECPCYTPDGTIVPFGATIAGDDECEIWSVYPFYLLFLWFF